jgi:hypothetical protein
MAAPSGSGGNLKVMMVTDETRRECGIHIDARSPIACELLPDHLGWHSTLNPERWSAVQNVAWPPVTTGRR